jgi:hypothetical protein
MCTPSAPAVDVLSHTPMKLCAVVLRMVLCLDCEVATLIQDMFGWSMLRPRPKKKPINNITSSGFFSHKAK